MKNKIKIMKMKPEVTDEEIRATMDFDRLMEQYKAAPAPPFRWRNGFIIAGAVIMLSASVWYFVSQGNEGKVQRDVASDKQTTNANNQVDSLSGKIATVEKPRAEENALSSTEQEQPKKPEKSTVKKSEPKTEEKAPTKQETEVPVQPVYAQAEPVDGYENLYAYFRRELKYPESGLKDSIQGEVTVVFTINTDGQPENISIENSLGKAFDQESVRLIEHMPKWKAATYNNKPVASRISVPITFQVKRIKK